MINSKLIEEVAEKAQIQMPDNKRERFILKRMIQSVYHLGFSDGMETEKKINEMLKKWADK